MLEDCKRIARETGDLAAFEYCTSNGEQGRCQERSAFCPIYRTMRMWERWGIPERERILLKGDILGTKPLSDRLSMRVVKARVARRVGPAGVKGTEALVVLAGKCDVGKTVAATWALSRTGGRYITACEFSELGLRMRELKDVNTLVIDQLGTEPIGGSEWALGTFLDVVDNRFANMRLTIVCTNMLREEFEPRYSRIFTRRLNSDGVFVRLGDAS